MTYSHKLPYHYKLKYQKNFNILVEEYKVIYFNTQKNANSTLKSQFVEILNLPKTEKYPDDIHYNYNFPTAFQHELTSKYNDFLKFSVLRNPWERLASCYNNKIRQKSRTGKDYILECSPKLKIGMSFEEFVNVICEIPDSESDFHFCSQIYLMLYPDGMFPMNYLCNIERLDFHLQEIRSISGLPFDDLPKINSSAKSDYQSMYTPSMIEKVGKRYEADIEFFRFEFGKMNDQFSFGEVSDQWLQWIMEHSLMISLLKEKNRELNQTVLLKYIQTKELNDLKREIDVLKNEVKNFEDSLSWKITKPLRSISSIFNKK